MPVSVCVIAAALLRCRIKRRYFSKDGGAWDSGRRRGSFDSSGYRGGGSGGLRSGPSRGNMGRDQGTEDQVHQARRQREAAQFFTYQKRLARTGLPPKEDRYWAREERELFGEFHVTAGINFEKYDDIPVERIGGQGTETPLECFQDAVQQFSLPPELAANFERCGYSSPTPVQKHSIPAALSGTDVMVSAQTGAYHQKAE